jgi:hypothetical protein
LHNMVKQLSTAMAFRFRWTNLHLRKFRIETRNLLGLAKPNYHMRFKADNGGTVYHREF